MYAIEVCPFFPPPLQDLALFSSEELEGASLSYEAGPLFISGEKEDSVAGAFFFPLPLVIISSSLFSFFLAAFIHGGLELF